MRSRTISVPVLALIGSTRGMLGAGLGLLLASRMSDSRRKGVGRTLLAVGLLTTVPLLLYIFGGRSEEEPEAADRRAPRSGGLVDAPGKQHRTPPPSLHGNKHFDQSVAKARMADEVRYRPRG
jgi:hypothetical protein